MMNDEQGVLNAEGKDAVLRVVSALLRRGLLQHSSFAIRYSLFESCTVNSIDHRYKGFLALLLLPVLTTWLTPKKTRAQDLGPRYGHDIVYDEQRDQVLLFGGFHDDGRPLGDTWSWDGQTWRRVAIEGPAPRKWPSMVYDAKRGQVLLFGGRTEVGQTGASLSDTWMWDGQTWHELPVLGPSARDHHRIVYDRKRDRVVLFGGWDGEKLLADTWEWDGKQWRQVAQEGPSARAPFGLVYDEHNEQVVLFGGKTLEVFLDDTWIWDGMQWSALPVKGPSPRAFHAMAYDPDGKQVLLFSGRAGDTMLKDTWAWDGQEWKHLAHAGPLKRGVYALVYDRVRHQAMFYGSGIREEGQWILDAETWIWKDNAWHMAR